MLSSKPYQCQRCPRAFARLEHLQRHDRSRKISTRRHFGAPFNIPTDTKEKPFVCLQCPKAFTRKYVMALCFMYEENTLN